MVRAGANGNLKHPKADVQDIDVSFNISCTVGQKTVPMFGCFAKIELEQIEKIK